MKNFLYLSISVALLSGGVAHASEPLSEGRPENMHPTLVLNPDAGGDISFKVSDQIAAEDLYWAQMAEMEENKKKALTLMRSNKSLARSVDNTGESEAETANKEPKYKTMEEFLGSMGMTDSRGIGFGEDAANQENIISLSGSNSLATVPSIMTSQELQAMNGATQEAPQTQSTAGVPTILAMGGASPDAVKGGEFEKDIKRIEANQEKFFNDMADFINKTVTEMKETQMASSQQEPEPDVTPEETGEFQYEGIVNSYKIVDGSILKSTPKGVEAEFKLRDTINIAQKSVRKWIGVNDRNIVLKPETGMEYELNVMSVSSRELVLNDLDGREYVITR
ncbi:TPA: hypothetical protein I7730_20395 [Vibrio vulnificus]|uniref:Uncharacterized protein n=1 Tax=Vibrio vulnificus TaxID=672 RepID=A0A8H9TH71_VIBVL|nr:hypothetical protein [Vibrio vulnificus]HAS8542152.1 hypothetical protein [Vibrio vulnificus]